MSRPSSREPGRGVVPHIEAHADQLRQIRKIAERLQKEASPSDWEYFYYGQAQQRLQRQERSDAMVVVILLKGVNKLGELQHLTDTAIDRLDKEGKVCVWSIGVDHKVAVIARRVNGINEFTVGLRGAAAAFSVISSEELLYGTRLSVMLDAGGLLTTPDFALAESNIEQAKQLRLDSDGARYAAVEDDLEALRQEAAYLKSEIGASNAALATGAASVSASSHHSGSQ